MEEIRDGKKIVEKGLWQVKLGESWSLWIKNLERNEEFRS
jgi:hypothetical protein